MCYGDPAAHRTEDHCHPNSSTARTIRARQMRGQRLGQRAWVKGERVAEPAGRSGEAWAFGYGVSSSIGAESSNNVPAFFSRSASRRFATA